MLHHGNMERAVKVLERMENQNTFKELAMDFKVHRALHGAAVTLSIFSPSKLDIVRLSILCVSLAIISAGEMS